MAVLRLSNVKKTWYYLRKNGISAAYTAVLERLFESRQAPYCYTAPSREELQKQRTESVTGPCISVVVPAYETRPEHLIALLDSLEAQSYPHWELVLADASADSRVEDTLRQWAAGRSVTVTEETAGTAEHSVAVTEKMQKVLWQDRCIRYGKLTENGGISANTNAGIQMAAGAYIGLLDHDDLLTPDALFWMAQAIEQEKKKEAAPLVLYSDEDKCDGDGTVFYEPHRKTDFDPELLLTNNYICHFLVMEGGLMKRLLLRSSFDGAQDFDLVLRAYAGGGRFAHVPRVLYHWRCHEASTAANPRSKTYAYEAGKRAVEDFCRQAGWRVQVSHLKHLGFYRVDYEGSVFSQRREIGILAGPLPGKGRLSSGIYEADKSQRYQGLRRGFSGPMHRAALQQQAETADLRSMQVCSKLQPLYEDARQQLTEAGCSREAAYELSMRFCQQARQAGYRILWDPRAGRDSI